MSKSAAAVGQTFVTFLETLASFVGGIASGAVQKSAPAAAPVAKKPGPKPAAAAPAKTGKPAAKPGKTAPAPAAKTGGTKGLTKKYGLDFSFLADDPKKDQKMANALGQAKLFDSGQIDQVNGKLIKTLAKSLGLTFKREGGDLAALPKLIAATMKKRAKKSAAASDPSAESESEEVDSAEETDDTSSEGGEGDVEIDLGEESTDDDVDETEEAAEETEADEDTADEDAVADDDEAEATEDAEDAEDEPSDDDLADTDDEVEETADETEEETETADDDAPAEEANPVAKFWSAALKRAGEWQKEKIEKGQEEGSQEGLDKVTMLEDLMRWRKHLPTADKVREDQIVATFLEKGKAAEEKVIRGAHRVFIARSIDFNKLRALEAGKEIPLDDLIVENDVAYIGLTADAKKPKVMTNAIPLIPIKGSLTSGKCAVTGTVWSFEKTEKGVKFKKIIKE